MAPPKVTPKPILPRDLEQFLMGEKKGYHSPGKVKDLDDAAWLAELQSSRHIDGYELAVINDIMFGHTHFVIQSITYNPLFKDLKKNLRDHFYVKPPENLVDIMPKFGPEKDVAKENREFGRAIQIYIDKHPEIDMELRAKLETIMRSDDPQKMAEDLGVDIGVTELL